MLHIIPVYPFASAIDLLIINSIEFHTGTNPLTDKPRLAVRDGHQEIVAPDGSRATSRMNDDGSVTIEITEPGGAEHRIRLVPVPGGVEARDADGLYLGRVDANGLLHTAEGAISLVPGA